MYVLVCSFSLYASHENASGYYRVSAYFLAKIFSDVVPMRLIPAALYCGITYFMIGEIRAGLIITHKAGLSHRGDLTNNGARKLCQLLPWILLRMILSLSLSLSLSLQFFYDKKSLMALFCVNYENNFICRVFECIISYGESSRKTEQFVDMVKY